MFLKWRSQVRTHSCARYAIILLLVIILKYFVIIGLVHSFDPGFTVTCGVDGCPKTFTKYNSFRKHILRHHRVLSLKSTNQLKFMSAG